MNEFVRSLLVGLIALLLALPAPAAAQAPSIPPDLVPWVDWVKERDPQSFCALSATTRVCVWPGVLDLNVTGTGGTFRYTGSLDSTTTIQLPGHAGAWPIDVRLNGSATPPVLERMELPFVRLGPGSFELTGAFRWVVKPTTLTIPDAAGLLNLVVDGEQVASPRRSDPGTVWLGDEQDAKEEEHGEDSLKAQVFRRLQDGIPFTVRTQLVLDVSGRGRDVTFGRIHPVDTEITGIATSLRYRVTDDKRLVVHVVPGRHYLAVDSMRTTTPERLAPVPSPLAPAADETLSSWPAHEVWSWQAAPALQLLEVTGTSLIDPSRVDMPLDWKHLPTYLVKAGSEMHFKVLERIAPKPQPNALAIQRVLWLDPEGERWSVSDTFSGRIGREWRLEPRTPLTLGSAFVNGEPVIVTKNLKNGAPGVELRSSTVSLTAHSTLEGRERSPEIGGWNTEVESAAMELRLPPGWKALHIGGSPASLGGELPWISKWDLFDVFSVLLVSLLFFKLMGLGAGLAALVTFALLRFEQFAPFAIWLHVLVSFVLTKLLKPALAHALARAYLATSSLLLALVAALFVGTHLLQTWFPRLWIGLRDPIFEVIYALAEQAPFYVLPLLVLSGFAAVRLLSGYFRHGIGLGLACVALWFVCLSIEGATGGFGGRAPLSEAGTLASSSIAAPAAAPQRLRAAKPAARRYEDSKGAPAQDAMLESFEMAPEPEGGALNALGKETERRDQDLEALDPNARVQTGPALPDGTYSSVHARWNAPVPAGEHTELWLLSPQANLLLGLARVLLVLILVACVLRRVRALGRPVAAALALLLVCGAPRADAQSFPSTEILTELQNRLLRDRCTEHCTKAHAADVTVKDREITLTAAITSDGAGAWKLPGTLDTVSFESMTLDGRPLRAARRDDAGLLEVRIPSGLSTLVARGLLAQSNQIALDFPDAPGSIRTAVEGWDVTGVQDDGTFEGTLVLSRSAGTSTTGGTEEPTPIYFSSWLVVTRSFSLGNEWQARTTFTRTGDLRPGEHRTYALLPGERSLSKEIQSETRDGRVFVNIFFGAGQSQVTMLTSLDKTSSFELSAPSEGRITERWILSCSSTWRCTHEGLSPTRLVNDARQEPSWTPWPGESVVVKVARPEATEGEDVTIQNVSLSLTPGERFRQVSLSATLTAGASGWEELTFPKDAEMTSATLNGSTLFVEPGSGLVRMELARGTNVFSAQLRLPGDPRSIEAPALRFKHPLHNVHLNYSVPHQKWLVWATGGTWGPVLFYWTKLSLILVFALVIAFSKLIPIGIVSAVLLGFGLSTQTPALALVPIAWFAAFSYRDTHRFSRPLTANAFQLLLVALTFAFVAALFAMVQTGLIVAPDMSPSGPFTNPGALGWYYPGPTAELPSPTMVLAPIGMWRALMLAWSVWLVLALFGWMRWAWERFSEGGIWQVSKQSAATESPAAPKP